MVLARSTSVQNALLHNAPIGLPLQLAQTSHTTMVSLQPPIGRLQAMQKESSAEPLYQADSCLSSPELKWPHFRHLPCGIPSLFNSHSFLYYPSLCPFISVLSFLSTLSLLSQLF
ncbi:hypothetical protein ILYODFUR_030993 [Ilyodon furcidens]|uniref:Uncharacterized protein n=1 Tax=Ilyodon furcidens TaxID=33524 RepID=A0ABV0UMS5_9TELE